MKTVLQLLLAGVALLLGACSTVQTRIQEKSAVYNSLDPATQAKLAHGDIEIGYTADMVYIALGRPDMTREKISTEGRTEQWIYRSYYDDYAGGAYLHYHRWYSYNPYGRFYRMYWEPVYLDSGAQYAEDNIRITFRDGRVIMIDQART